jgi:hypothetical protein
MNKARVLRRSAIAVAVSTVFLLTACGGGGGGGGGGGYGGGNPSYIKPDTPYYSSGTLANYGFTSGSRSTVPFSTPTQVSTFNPYSSDSPQTNVSQQYVVNNLTGSGGDDLIVTGRMSQSVTADKWVNSSIQLFNWENGSFVNNTAKWFPNGINSILGTDPTVQFADFFKTGRTDMLISPSTDMNYYGPTGSSQALLFKNTGSQFNLNTIELGAQVWGHGATIADLTKTGWQDAIIADYGPNTTFLMNNRVNGFNVYQARGQNDLFFGTSSIAAADFMKNGSTQIVATDSRVCANDSVVFGCTMSSTTKMYTWSIDPVTNKLSINWAQDLPAPILGNGSHNYLVINYDFNSSGNQSLIVFSQPDLSTYNKSAIQFLQNDGKGNFTDVTGTMLKGYNTNTVGTYHPQFVDLGNGQMSMIVSAQDWSGSNSSTQFLIKQSATGPYVAAFQNIITDFASQSNLIAGSSNRGNQVAVVKDSSKNLYLVTTLQYQSDANSPMRMATYLSLVGANINTTTAQTAFNAVKATWPWMSSAQVNQVLAQTSSSYMTDAGTGLVLNPDKIMNPIGSLNVATRSGLTALTGGIAGVNMTGLNLMQAFDSVGRNYSLNFGSNNYVGPNSFTFNTEHIDQYNLTSHTEYMLNGNTNTVYNPQGMPLRMGVETRNQFNTIGAPIMPKEFGDQSGNQGLYLGSAPPTQWSFGFPEMYRRGNFYTGMQFTSLNSNPWLNFNGSFGSVTGSGTLEQVMTYAKDGFSVQGAVMRTTTNFKSGIITNVSPITAAWAETGYRYNDQGFGDLGIYVGVKPVVLSGNITATIPTSVDNAGNITYTNTKLGVMSQTTPYVRALYTGSIDRNSGYRLSGMATQDGKYRAMAEYRYHFN